MPTPRLNLPYLSVDQANKEIKHNEALIMLDVAFQLIVADKDLSAPPGSPTDGAAYIVAATGSGAWAGHTGSIAVWFDEVGVWLFIPPIGGMRAYVTDEGIFYQYSGSAWVGNAFVLMSVTDTITASTTQTQIGATALNTQCGRITTCANTGDSVRINYAALPGMSVEILNEGAQSAWMWPFTGGSFDAGAANARDANALTAGSVRRYRCFTAGVWQTV